MSDKQTLLHTHTHYVSLTRTYLSRPRYRGSETNVTNDPQKHKYQQVARPSTLKAAHTQTHTQSQTGSNWEDNLTLSLFGGCFNNCLFEYVKGAFKMLNWRSAKENIALPVFSHVPHSETCSYKSPSLFSGTKNISILAYHYVNIMGFYYLTVQ